MASSVDEGHVRGASEKPELDSLHSLSAVLSRIDAHKSRRQEGPSPAAGGTGLSSSSAAVTLPSSQTASSASASAADAAPTASPVWYEFIDPASGKSYFHNYSTAETTWTAPASFVPASTSLPGAPAVDYSAKGYFNRNNGRFTSSQSATEHWDNIGIPADRAGRQLAHYVDLQELERNRAETKKMKEERQSHPDSSIDWKKYNQNKKEEKKRKRNAWLLES